MSMSLVMRAIVAATALCIAPALASAQAPQTKACKDGTTSTRTTFACFGHGGVDTAHAPARDHASAGEHHPAEPVQAGEPRAKHAKSTAHKASKATAHHARAEHHDSRSAKKKQETHRGWLPWRHKKEKEQPEKKKKPKHRSASRLPVAERPNGQRQR